MGDQPSTQWAIRSLMSLLYVYTISLSSHCGFSQVDRFFKRNAKAFSLNAIVDVRRRRLRRRHEMIFLISWKLLELATSKFIAS